MFSSQTMVRHDAQRFEPARGRDAAQLAAQQARRMRFGTATGGHDNPTLKEALMAAQRSRWINTRAALSTYSQARAAAETLAALALQDDGGTGATAANASDHAMQSVRISQVSQQLLLFAIDVWRADGLAPGTINKRLSCLSVMGVNVRGRRQKRRKVLKWWLKPDVERDLVRSLMGAGDDLMADYITWTTHTGLRVEESLALTKADFLEVSGEVSVTVPGLKTVAAQATLPLGAEASEVYRARIAPDAPPDTRLFPINYGVLLLKWNLCRVSIGADGDAMSTLKALRRSAARYLHVERGMPLELVRNYLRHENIQTTLDYLRLTGSADAGEMRRWL